MRTLGKKPRMTKRAFQRLRGFCLILLTVSCVLSPVRCTKKIYQVEYPALNDGKYDTEFPYKDCSKQLMEIGEAVKRVNCIAYYKAYIFQKEDDIIDQRLKYTNLAKKASHQFYYDKTSSGTATVIYNEDDKIGLLTCAHIIDNPDTVVTYFMLDSLEKIKIIQSVAVKREQQNWVPDLPVGEAMEIIHMDSDKDIAILGKSGIRSDKRVPVFRYPYGKSSNLGWGSFVYIFGYPVGNKMITRAIVSNPRKDGKGNFLIDANFNRGLSGGIVLAIKDGVPNFEMVGMAKSVSASNEYILQPEEKVEDYSYDPRIPYLGDTYVRLQSTIHYGVTHVISMETIQQFRERFVQEDRKMKKAAFLLIILFLFTRCNPDTNEIAGKVIDKSTEAVIENVHVVIKGSDLKSETDTNGVYSLTGLPDSDYSILYIHQNYDTLVVNANEMETGETYRIDVALNQRHQVPPRPL